MHPLQMHPILAPLLHCKGLLHFSRIQPLLHPLRFAHVTHGQPTTCC
jgi:hypothetical protein